MFMTGHSDEEFERFTNIDLPEEDLMLIKMENLRRINGCWVIVQNSISCVTLCGTPVLQHVELPDPSYIDFVNFFCFWGCLLFMQRLSWTLTDMQPISSSTSWTAVSENGHHASEVSFITDGMKSFMSLQLSGYQQWSTGYTYHCIHPWFSSV